MFDKWNYELEDSTKAVKASNIAEVYYHVMRHDVISKEVETSLMD
jgi:hypothetical protein